MKKPLFRQILAGLLLGVMVLSCLPFTAGAAGASRQGTFALTVVTEEKVVIEPEFISYDVGDRLCDALKKSAHSFSGLEDGYVTAIDDVTDNFCLFYADNGYALDGPADQVETLCFTTEQNHYSEEYLALVHTMAEYNGDTSGVQNYPQAQKAYADALAGLYGGSAEAAAQLRQGLQEEMDAFAAYLKGDTVPLHLSITQGDTTNRRVNATFTGTFGNRVTVEDAQVVNLIPGTYTFDISDGGINHVRGSVTVSAEQTLTAALPTGQWIADVDISIASGEAWKAVSRKGNTYYVPDYAEGNLYPYIEPGEGVDTTACGVYLADTPNAYRRTWRSKQTALSALIAPKSMEGESFALEARLTQGEFEQYQRYPMEIVRVPSLKSLEIRGDGTQLPLNFTAETTEYSLTTVSDTLEISAQALCGEAQVTIQGTPGESATVPVQSTLTVKVSHSNGQSTTYSLSMKKVASVSVVLTHDGQTSVLVENQAGAIIAPKHQGQGESTFALIPGEKYSYIATKNTYYHTTAAFTAREGLRVAAPTPDTGDWLEALHVGPTRTVSYDCDRAFQPENHAYTYEVGSNQTGFGILATLGEGAKGYSITAYYPDYRQWDSSYGQKSVSITDNTYKSVTAFLGTSGEGNELRLEIQTERSGVTYYQEYVLTARRLLQLNSLAVSVNGRSLPLTKETGTQGFDKAVLSYSTSLGQTLGEISVNLRLYSTLSGKDNEVQVTLTCGDGVQTLDYAALTANEVQRVTLPLNTELGEERLLISLERRNAISQTYEIVLQKLPPIETVFRVTPEDAVVFLREEQTGDRVLPQADGKSYQLNTDSSYAYAVTSYGYAAQTGTFTAGQDHALISVQLEKTPETDRKELLQEGDWPSFRGNDENNGLTASATPILAENTVLNWANKLGEGYSEGAVGSPIIVGGSLYTYAGDQVMKVDRETGELLLSKPMDRSSSFSITPPAYGEGMIFVALSNGAVQAFDGETLESLWLYQDALGGQPNCPITYSNGYIYTGFWNSESKEANFVCISVTDEDPSQTKEAKAPSWTYTGKGFYWSGAYVSDNFLLVTTEDGKNGYTTGHGEILSLNPRTGCLIDSMTAQGVGDLRSSVCYDESTDAYYFTSKGGDFYCVKVDGEGKLLSQKRLHLTNAAPDSGAVPMSTSTPTVYKGRAYIGVAGASQFGAYSGHAIAVIDLAQWRTAYTVPTQGYPQTSGLLTTAYEDQGIFVYFIDNYTPGVLRLLKDKPGQTQPDPDYLTREVYTSGGSEETVLAAYALFTPAEAQAQYAICSPIADGEGNLYFKNDSGYMMCLGSVVTELKVTKEPDQLVYEAGEIFNPQGLQVTARFANGAEKDVTKYIRFSQEPLTQEDGEFTLSYSLGRFQKMYQNRDGQGGVPYYVPTATLDLTMNHTHVWNEGVVTREPTAMEAGEKTFTCTLCGVTKTEILPATGKCDGGENCVSREMTDVPVGIWYHSAVDYVVSHGLMIGVSSSTFAPDTPMTRAQLVTILWRQAGSPEPVGENPFLDLTAPWYEKAVIWASENGIVNGMAEGRFVPEGTLTREQLAVILYRYAGDYLHLNTEERADFSSFADPQAVSSWAQEAMQWAVARGLVSGSSEGGKLYLIPGNSASRAQVAAILMRFLG